MLAERRRSCCGGSLYASRHHPTYHEIECGVEHPAAVNCDLHRLRSTSKGSTYTLPPTHSAPGGRDNCYPVAGRPVGAGRWAKDTNDHVIDNAAVPSDLISQNL